MFINIKKIFYLARGMTKKDVDGNDDDNNNNNDDDASEKEKKTAVCLTSITLHVDTITLTTAERPFLFFLHFPNQTK